MFREYFECDVVESCVFGVDKSDRHGTNETDSPKNHRREGPEKAFGVKGSEEIDAFNGGRKEASPFPTRDGGSA